MLLLLSEISVLLISAFSVHSTSFFHTNTVLCVTPVNQTLTHLLHTLTVIYVTSMNQTDTHSSHIQWYVLHRQIRLWLVYNETGFVLTVVVVVFSSLARILGECSIIHSPPALFFLSEVEISSRTVSPLFYARVSPQWLSELRRLWPNVAWHVACVLVSG